jgi:hypothetical protein
MGASQKFDFSTSTPLTVTILSSQLNFSLPLQYDYLKYHLDV